MNYTLVNVGSRRNDPQQVYSEPEVAPLLEAAAVEEAVE